MARPNVSQPSILEFLKDNGSHTVEDLIFHLKYSEPTIRKSLSCLIGRGLVKEDRSSRPFIYKAAE